MEKLYTVDEVAKYLGVTEETVRRWLRSGKLEGALLSRKAGWRIRQGAIDRMLIGEAQGKELAAA